MRLEHLLIKNVSNDRWIMIYEVINKIINGEWVMIDLVCQKSENRGIKILGTQ